MSNTSDIFCLYVTYNETSNNIANVIFHDRMVNIEPDKYSMQVMYNISHWPRFYVQYFDIYSSHNIRKHAEYFVRLIRKRRVH